MRRDRMPYATSPRCVSIHIRSDGRYTRAAAFQQPNISEYNSSTVLRRPSTSTDSHPGAANLKSTYFRISPIDPASLRPFTAPKRLFTISSLFSPILCGDFVFEPYSRGKVCRSFVVRSSFTVTVLRRGKAAGNFSTTLISSRSINSTGSPRRL